MILFGVVTVLANWITSYYHLADAVVLNANHRLSTLTTPAMPVMAMIQGRMVSNPLIAGLPC